MKKFWIIALCVIILIIVALIPIWILLRSPSPCKIYGLDIGFYTKEGQVPGDTLNESEIRELIEIIAPYTEWIRTYGVGYGNELAGNISHEFGLKVAITAWIEPLYEEDPDYNYTKNQNDVHIAKLIDMGNNGEADLLIVGNEYLLRCNRRDGNITNHHCDDPDKVDQLIAYIQTVKNETEAAVPDIQVAYAESILVLLNHPEVIREVDIIMYHYYPSGTPGVTNSSDAIDWFKRLHQDVLNASNGKPVWIGETGWPSGGCSSSGTEFLPEDAASYFLDFVSWAEAEDIPYFYFQAFDEPWLAEAIGMTSAAHMGIWDAEGNLKPGMRRVFDCEAMPSGDS